MAIMNNQQESGTGNQCFESTKSQCPVLDEISRFHETLETERVHRVLAKWRKRKRDEEVSTGTAILEKILRTLQDEFESRKERAELWDRALIAEIKTDRARLELDSHTAASTLTSEKQTQVVQAVASVLNIGISGEELEKMLSKTAASDASAAREPTKSMRPPTPPADQHSPVMPHNPRALSADTHIREPSPRRPPVLPHMSSPPSRSQTGPRLSSLPPRSLVAPRILSPPSRPASRAASSGDYTTSSQVLGLQASGGKTRSPTRIETADPYAPTQPNKRQRTEGPSALKTSSPEKRPTRPVRNIRVSD
ncbi:hypothetical protein KVR01_009841 [Diaporthe batatas]|uniref:uncharacterized protein n=1 Tax=Diaporthe batatas TaxID=748121 RepID=UPI001D037F0A|nr:uncharacterized protein KVR01_009841 [Diaporthe batatas]KAG8160305.1 hypothetical protein KVR01_009841 [Diaporthe batatas]